MVTVDDIADVVKARFEAMATYGTALLGKAWWDRGPDAPNYPYEVHEIEANEKELFSGPVYLQTWRVSFSAFCPVGETGVNPNALEQFLNSAFGTDGANAAIQAMPLRNVTEAVLHCLPRADTGSYAMTLRDGRDVFTVGMGIEILVQGDKSVS